jgi:hypothetical protein
MQLTLALALPLLLAVPAQTDEQPEIDFAALGREFAQQYCPEAGSGEEVCPLESVLAQRGHADVGPFRIFFPLEMAVDKDAFEDLQGIVLAVHALSAEWVRWQGAGAELPDAEKVLKRWAKTKPVKAGDLAKRPDARDLFDLLAAEPETRAPFDALVELCDSSDDLALVVPEGQQIRLILAPTRKEFMGWAGYSGLIDETQQAVNWDQTAATWAQFWLGWDLVLALEYSPWTGFDPTFETGKPMEEIGAGVMAQHVVQQASIALLHTTRPHAEESRNDSALAMLLTIGACGEINTIEGAGGVGTSGASASPYERFVPGGNPHGGMLPGRSASALSGLVENHWRKGHGEDAFRAPLREGQAEGAKAVKKDKEADPLAHFVLRTEDGRPEVHVIHAPFFGPHANEQAYPPPEYLVDYAEFYRAYKTCLLDWIRTRGAGPEDAEANAAAWSKVIRALAAQDRSFEAIVEEVYGVPISGKDATTHSLEFRFLAELPDLK